MSADATWVFAAAGRDSESVSAQVGVAAMPLTDKRSGSRHRQHQCRPSQRLGNYNTTTSQRSSCLDQGLVQGFCFCNRAILSCVDIWRYALDGYLSLRFASLPFLTTLITPSKMADIQARLQALSEEYTKLQKGS
jgi:hypothetical protein